METKVAELVRTLQTELTFLNQGGYRCTPYGVPLIFEDSPTCKRRKGDLANCSECLLTLLVPPGDRSRLVPCRHIPLDASNRTALDYYASGTKEALEETLRHWLVGIIEDLRTRSLSAGLVSND